jgi:polyhydroxyalkanoate synthase
VRVQPARTDPQQGAKNSPAQRRTSTAASSADDTLDDTTAAAEQAVSGTDPVGVPSLTGTLADTAAVFSQFRALNREGGALAAELAHILLGSSEITPDRKDWRFTDPAWSENPVYRRVAQSYLASCGFLDAMVDERGKSGQPTYAARFLLNVLSSAAAPTNTLAGNPAALKRAFETGGGSLRRGVGNWWHDLRHNGGMPATADRGAFEVGRDLAITPGAVVDRDAYGEVIQYQPVTEHVRKRPVLIVPPPIGRFYFLDLRPGRSFAEYAVSRGLQTFMVSWRNPTSEQAGWDLDDYARRVLSAIDTVRDVAGTPDIDVIGFCAGGIITTTVLNHLAAIGDPKVATVSYAVTLHDFSQPAPISAFSSPKLLALARRNSRRAGVISAQAMGAVFSWMRPNELVWNYWVNNYLMGNPPPVFDILAWNADGTNLPAALHRQFLEIFHDNVLCQPGATTVLGTPVDLSRITLPAYVTGGVTDHLTPWQGCYQTTQLLSGPATFVLSNAGHIQSLVNPPGNAKATYFAGGKPGPDPQQWLAESEKVTGTWWEHWTEWLLEHSSDEVPAPKKLGGGGHAPGDQAPGLYVRDLLPA